jgi:hypothetical protein
MAAGCYSSTVTPTGPCFNHKTLTLESIGDRCGGSIPLGTFAAFPSAALPSAALLSAAAAPKSAGVSKSSCSSSVSTDAALLCRPCSGPSTDSATSNPAPCARSWLGLTAGTDK